jgi:hypothetical protein
MAAMANGVKAAIDCPRVSTGSLKLHPKADIVPRMTNGEWVEFLADVGRRGVVEPLTIQQPDIILDGRHRWDAGKAADLESLPVRYVDLKPDEQFDYMLSAALLRRNLTGEQQSYLRGKRHQSEKSKHGGDRKSESKGQNVPLNTAERLGQEYGVSGKTIQRDADFAEAVDTIAEVDPSAKEAILAGDLGTKADVIAVAELPKTKQKAAVKGGKKAVKEAAKEVRAEKATKDLPSSKTPHQQAKESPEGRWLKGLHELYVLLNSVRDNGGMAKLTAKWCHGTRQDYVLELREIIGTLEKWVNILEVSK